MKHKVDTWHGCYPSNWKGKIVPESMAHPAKYSSKLIRKIYEHLRDEGWVQPGDKVVDPFGGVALGALDAMSIGLSWRGVELEPRFVRLGQGYDCPGIDKSEWIRWQKRLSRNVNICPACQSNTGLEYSQNSGITPFKDSHHYLGNIEFWNKRFAGKMPNWGDAELFQGDSRDLCNLLNLEAVVAVSSPPYADSVNTSSCGIDWDKAGRPDRVGTNTLGIQGANGHAMHYGATPGQLGAMKAKGFDAAVSSPPFTDQFSSHDNFIAPHDSTRLMDTDKLAYGATPGQLGAMKAKGFDAAVSSPPFIQGKSGGDAPMENNGGDVHRWTDESYGTTDGQLANEKDDDFWQAARQIVEQVYLALTPGGHAVWVVKDFVKNKQRVPFCNQWRELCESVGFITIHEHHASLVKHRGTSHTLFGGEVEHVTSSKSFFRRLAEKKGSPPIDWEVVFCMEKAI